MAPYSSFIQTLFITTILSLCKTNDAFRTSTVSARAMTRSRSSITTVIPSKMTTEDEYSQDIRLREEAESPFRKVRFFFYASLGAGALQSLLVSSARIAAGLSGINADLLDESLTNAAVDLTGIVVIAFLTKRDLEAQESKLKRAKKGGDLARLMIRASKKLADEDTFDNAGYVTTNLSSLRRGRGMEQRVVIAAAGKEKVAEIVEEAKRLQDKLIANDLLIVPVVLPQGVAPEVIGDLPECVALPVGLNWKTVVDDETAEARKQVVNVEGDGIAIILKKNGRVGQRTKGIFLGQMVGDVEDRKAFGLDVKNI
jgi:Low psii accumulation1 / Rep27